MKNHWRTKNESSHSKDCSSIGDYMKKLAKIPAILLSKEDSTVLKLKNEYYAVLIPRNLIENSGISSNIFDFDLISKNGVMSLETSLAAKQGTGLMMIDD